MIQKKICMVGAFGVGKTSLVARFVHSIFSEKYQTTIGVKIDKKQLTVDGGEVTLMLWDLAGEDAVTQVRATQLRGASGYILVADGLRASTLESAIHLQARVVTALGDVPFVCVVNKADMRDGWEISDAQCEVLVERGWNLCFASAKTGDQVEEVFVELARRILKEAHVRTSDIGASA